MKKSKILVWLVVLVVLMTGVLSACQSGFKVTYSAGENGTLTATADGESFVSGSKAEADKSIEFAAAPNSGYTVDVWTVNAGSKRNLQKTLQRCLGAGRRTLADGIHARDRRC